jgi:hypothetical protein
VTPLLGKFLSFVNWFWVLLTPTFVERMALVSRGMSEPGSNIFQSDDRTILLALLLSKPTMRTKVKVEWKALRVEAAQLNHPCTIMTAEYTTRFGERFVRSHVSSRQDWPVGAYSVAAYVDGVLAKTMNYEIVEPRPLVC